MDYFFAPPAPILPVWFEKLNLLRGFIWYVTFIFVLSSTLRARFYIALYRIARHVANRCPNVYRLLNEHRILCAKDGIIVWVGLYIAVLGAYMTMNYLVWPLASCSLLDLASTHPSMLSLGLALITIMMSLDFYLVLQYSVIDEEEVVKNLTDAEYWLGGRLNQWLSYLGKWNPIKKYADTQVVENLAWFNGLAHHSLRILILQLVLRMAVAGTLFVHFAWNGARGLELLRAT